MLYGQLSGASQKRQLLPPLVVQISRAECDAGENQRAGCRKGNRIKRGRRKRNHTSLICARGPANITACPRCAKSLGETFELCRQFRVASWNAVSAANDIGPQLGEFFDRQPRRVPVCVERRPGAGERSFASDQATPGIHIHRGKRVAGEKDAIRRAEERNVTGRMPGRRKPLPPRHAGHFLRM